MDNFKQSNGNGADVATHAAEHDGCVELRRLWEQWRDFYDEANVQGVPVTVTTSRASMLLARLFNQCMVNADWSITATSCAANLMLLTLRVFEQWGRHGESL